MGGRVSTLVSQLDRDMISAILIAILTFIMVVVAILFEKYRPESGNFHKFEVLNVLDGRTLAVEWLEHEEGTIPEGFSQFQVSGIWSDVDKEPSALYETRVQFLKDQLVKREISARTHIVVISPPPPPPHFDSEDSDYGPEPSQEQRKILEVMNDRSEVLLDDGTSLNELMLEKGYAAFDFTELRLLEEDRARYTAAEARATQTGQGIWSSQEYGRLYQDIRAKFELRERLKESGSVFYVLTQIALVIVTLTLMYVSRQDSLNFKAATKLLAIPVAMLMIELTRRTWVQFRPEKDLNFAYLYSYYFLVTGAIIWLGVKQLFVLVAHGPLKEWQTLWRISRARRAVRNFFIALWCSILLYSLAYRFFGGVDSLKTATYFSFSQTFSLNLPIIIEKTKALNTVVVVHSISIYLLLLLFGSLVPGLKNKPLSLSIRSALVLCVSSLFTLTLAVASMFANLFYYNIHLEGFNRPLDLQESFFLALQLIIGKTYSDVYPLSGWMMIFQLVEIHLGLFLKVVALRFIFSVLRRAVETTQTAEDQVSISQEIR